MILTIKKMCNFALKKVEYYLLSFLNIIIPKSHNKIFIFDKRFRKDNAWAISQHLLINDRYKNMQVFYYTKSNMPSEGNITVISNGIYALWFQLRSQYIFYSYSDFRKMKPVRKQVIIDTMHGSPLKNIGYLSGNSRFKKKWKFENAFTHILCMSDFFKDIIQRSFGASDEQCLVLGYPRNDYIFSKEQVLVKLGINKKGFNKIILWMPTWRGNSRTGSNNESNIDFPIMHEDNIKTIKTTLEKNNILLLIKPHPNQLNLEILNHGHDNIIVLRNEDLERKNIFLYELFYEADALLTDYSSVYFDFLLTMKPIGFTIDDFDSYGDKRGFVVDDPLEIMPGWKITNIDELVTFMIDIKKGKDEFYEDRKRINDIVNKYKDGNSCSRIFEHLGL